MTDKKKANRTRQAFPVLKMFNLCGEWSTGTFKIVVYRNQRVWLSFKLVVRREPAGTLFWGSGWRGEWE